MPEDPALDPTKHIGVQARDIILDSGAGQIQRIRGWPLTSRALPGGGGRVSVTLSDDRRVYVTVFPSTGNGRIIQLDGPDTLDDLIAQMRDDARYRGLESEVVNAVADAGRQWPELERTLERRR
jgi:hypothetical protein